MDFEFLMIVNNKLNRGVFLEVIKYFLGGMLSKFLNMILKGYVVFFVF